MARSYAPAISGIRKASARMQVTAPSLKISWTVTVVRYASGVRRPKTTMNAAHR